MGVAIFIGVWLVLGLSVVFIGLRGGPSRAREALYGEGRRQRRVTAGVLVVVYLAFGVAIPTLVVAKGENHDRNLSGSRRLSSSATHGRELFGKACVQCHTLKAANAVGRVGPSLDQLRPPKKLVLDAIRNGRARGAGRMPANLYQGKDAQDVASFVAAVAGRG